MAKPSDFKAGDYVEHMNGDTGRVTEIKPDGAVFVTFDRGKGYWHGEYDENWFRIHPDGLKKIDPPICGVSPQQVT
jgi:hypothetical protein